MRKPVVFKLLTLIAIPILGLVLVEGVLYLAGVKTTYESEDPFLGFKSVTPLFEKIRSSDGSELYVTRRTKLAWFNDQQFKAVKPENGYRIFCFGGSATFGRPYFYKTAFSSWLELILRTADPSTAYEVINVGGISYASYRVVNLMDEMVDYEPDLFIVYSGNNEFLEDRTYADILKESSAVTAVRSQLNKLRTYSVLRNAWIALQSSERREAEKKFEMTGEVNTMLDLSFGLDLFHRDTAKEHAILRHFELNLDHMVAISEEHGIPLIFVVPPSNEKDFSPFKSEFQSPHPPEDVRQWDNSFNEGIALMANGRYQEALHAFFRAGAIDSGYASLPYYEARCLLELDRTPEAKRKFDDALELDVAPLRATPAMQGIVRKVAGEHDILMVDLVRLLERKAAEKLGYPILGKEFFLDHVHPTIEVHEFIAEQLANDMVAHHLIEPQRELSQIPFGSLYDSVLATVDSPYYAMRDLNLAKVLEWAGKRQEAAPFIIRAAQTMPLNPEAHYYLGKMYQDRGDLGRAAAAYQQAIALDSSYSKAYNGLGTILDRMNRLEDAAAYFSEAVQLEDDFEQAYLNLGSVQQRLGRADEAIATYQKVLTLNARNPRALSNLGMLRMMRGELEDAAHSLTRAVEIEPHNAKAYVFLGVIRFQEGRLAEAHAMLERGLAANPQDPFTMEWIRRIDQHTHRGG